MNPFIIIQRYGFKITLIKVLRKTAQILESTGYDKKRRFINKKKFSSIVYREDVIKANWNNKKVTNSLKIKNRTNVISWVISPPSHGGGHQNMFRFIEYLDRSGFTNNIYLYSATDKMTTKEAAKNVSKYTNLKNVNFYYYKKNSMAGSDAIFATGWETCYPVFNEVTNAKKLYFIQDFEPYFYPVGTEYVLAENTYRFGFFGVTAGKWLSDKLRSEYGMDCEYYDLGADKEIYNYQNGEDRKEVFFYARPSTERRAFDLGIMTLEIFHRDNPEYKINLAGWDVSGHAIPFPYVNHKTLNLNQLNELYNKCSIGLVISLTNMSLLPLELLSAGVIPIVNEGLNNTAVSSNKYIKYAPASPQSLARAMSEVLKKKDLISYSREASESIPEKSWEVSKKKFLKIIRGEIYG